MGSCIGKRRSVFVGLLISAVVALVAGTGVSRAFAGNPAAQRSADTTARVATGVDEHKPADRLAAELDAGPVRLTAPSDLPPLGAGNVRYIVRYAAGADAGRESAELEAAGIDVGATFHDAFPGATVQATPTEAAALRRDPGVLSVVADQVVTLNDPPPPAVAAATIQASTIQADTTWGLDRSDQRNLPLSGTYAYDSVGLGVDVYVLDSGIRGDHADFGGRVLPGAFAINDGLLSGDCDGHGTHVAGTIGSATYGIAKGVWLIPVRVLDCSGAGSTSGIVASLDWIIARHVTGVPAVLNMSLGGPANSVVDAAVQSAINDGITVVAAAGNDGTDACGHSPARVSGVITVAATDETDFSPNWSSYGPCVDVFAPGEMITSTWNSSPTATKISNGTSMASPHVAGAAALALEHNPSLSPAQVASQLGAAATPGLVTNGGSTSPNLLLFAPPPITPPPTNDAFAAAGLLTVTATGSVLGSNVSATKEMGEPNHAESAGGRSVWWTLTSPQNGTVTLSTEGSSFDTVLDVYTGTLVAALTSVASNDDHDEHPTDRWSRLSFTAVAGTSYRIAVDGYAGRAGSITLQSTWQPTPSYVPVDPTRVADTRSGMTTIDGHFAGTGIVPGGGLLELTIAARAGVPGDATAVALNVTVTDTAGAGFITVFPCGAARPTSSNLNYVAGSTVANTAIAKVGAGGRVCLFTSVATHVVVDVNGYFPAGSSFASLVPARLMDTRPNAPTIDGQSAGLGLLATGSVTQLRVTGRAGVPDDAAAVVLNVTVTETSAAGYVTVLPCGASVPNGSNLNYVTGSTVPNAVIAKVGTAGSVCLFTSAGTHLIADINGYFPAGSSLTSLVPARLLETRPGLSTADGLFNSIGASAAGSILQLPVTGRAGVTADASAVVLNVTVTEPAGSGFVTIYPCGSGRPNVSNVNFVGGATTPNAVIVKVGGSGSICLFTSVGAHLIVDINGYFAAG